MMPIKVKIEAVPTNTPTPSVTANQTPTPTITPTRTLTPTPTPTSTTNVTADVSVENSSVNVPINNVFVNGVAVTYSSGNNFIMNPVSSGSFTTDQIGTYTVEVTYGACSSGQNISIIDSNSNFQCCDLNPAGGTCQFISVVVNTSASVNITCTDGTCP